MNRKKFFMTIDFSQFGKKQKRMQREIAGRKAGRLYGFNEHVLEPKGVEGFRVWVDRNQTPRELVDTFFHEMTHVMVRILRLSEKTLSKRDEEHMASWIGYLAKTQFNDRMPSKFCFRKRRRR